MHRLFECRQGEVQGPPPPPHPSPLALSRLPKARHRISTLIRHSIIRTHPARGGVVMEVVVVVVVLENHILQVVS